MYTAVEPEQYIPHFLLFGIQAISKVYIFKKYIGGSVGFFLALSKKEPLPPSNACKILNPKREPTFPTALKLNKIAVASNWCTRFD